MSSVILVISPHPDDLEIGMGGTVALAADSGAHVISAVLTDGRRSPRSFECSDDEMVQIRKREAEEAATVLGVRTLFFFGLHDLRSSEYQKHAREQLAGLLEQFRPQEIYLPHPELDRHESHCLGARACLESIKQTVADGKAPGPAVWAYEVWGLFPHWDRTENITGVIDKKSAAIECHRSQVTDVAYTEGVLGLNRWRAVFTDPHQIPSQRYVEAFIRL